MTAAAVQGQPSAEEIAENIPKAWVVSSRWRFGLALPVFFVLLIWLAHHALNLQRLVTGHGGQFTVMWIIVFGSLLWHVTLAWSERPYVIKTAEEQADLDRLRVVVNVPVYNEDPATLRLVLAALMTQTRMPQVISVVDDGSADPLVQVRDWFLARSDEFAARGTELSWTRTPNRGKRHAQLETLRSTSSDIFITTDSDTIAAPNAIEEGLKPFASSKITSVASMVLAYNHQSTFVRLTDAWLMTFQTTVRAAMGRLGCVLMNSGNFALYRTYVIDDAIDAYANETFAGQPVQFSDDSLLTLFAHLEGRTVQQPSSFAFTVLPQNISHHLRQQLRWMRGSTIRSVWRFRYLPVRSWGYWEHFVSWANFVIVSAAFIDIVVLAPVLHHALLPVMALFAVVVSLLTSFRYLTFRRTDQGLGERLLAWILSPVMLLWTALILRPLRVYAIATCWRTGWNTRKVVEVEMA